MVGLVAKRTLLAIGIFALFVLASFLLYFGFLSLLLLFVGLSIKIAMERIQPRQSLLT